MKTNLIVFVLALLCSITTNAQKFSPEDLHRRAIERRAVEAAIWGMPAVNYDLMLQEMLAKTPGKLNEVIYWGRPLDWKNQTLTPNPDTLYFMAFFNTKDAGPIVIDFPPAGDDGSMNANFVNIWQEPMEDAGLLGVDKGKGVKLLMLPPDYKEKIPDGYEAFAAKDTRQLRAVAIQPQKSRRFGRCQIAGLRQAPQNLSALPGRPSARNQIHRRQGRQFRFNDPLRHPFFRGAQSHYPNRTLAGTRSNDDRSPQDVGNRKRQTFRPGCRRKKIT
jgi:hypothetical protein